MGVEKSKHKVRNSYGVYDAFKYYRKNKPKDPEYILSESQYFTIIRRVNLLLCEDLLAGKDIHLPETMGYIEVRKTKLTLKEVNGKLKIPYPIDWHKTKILWEEDEEAKRDKILVRFRTDTLYMIKYIKRAAVYKHKSFYDFKPNRTLKRTLAKQIKQGNFDSFSI